LAPDEPSDGAALGAASFLLTRLGSPHYSSPGREKLAAADLAGTVLVVNDQERHPPLGTSSDVRQECHELGDLVRRPLHAASLRRSFLRNSFLGPSFSAINTWSGRAGSKMPSRELSAAQCTAQSIATVVLPAPARP
jgi:hypothetical protein